MSRPRRGWQQSVGHGIRRDHRVDCPRSADHKPRSRCGCPYSWWKPILYGAPRERSAPFYGTLAQAKAAKESQEQEAMKIRQVSGRLRAAPHGDGRMTIFTYAKMWLKHGETIWSPATLDSRATAYRLYLHETFGDCRICDLQSHMVDEWLRESLNEGKAYWSVVGAFKFLRDLYTHAVKRRVAEWNPVKVVTLPAPPEKSGERDHLTPAEYQGLLAACPSPTVELMVRLGVEAGFRRGEIAGIHASDIDDVDGTPVLHIKRNVVRGKGKPPAYRKPKSGLQRTVPLTNGLYKLLTSYLADHERGDDDAVFKSPRNPDLPFQPATVSSYIRTAIINAGLTNEDGGPRFTAHALRRTAATWASENGVDETVIRDVLGHRSQATTKRHYIRGHNPALESFAAALGTAATGNHSRL